MRVKQAGNELAEMKSAERAMVKRVCCGYKLDTDQEESTGSSSEEMDSPRSTLAKGVIHKKWSNNNNCHGVYLHSQILRIRAEDSHIGEDINHVALNFGAKDDRKQLQVESSAMFISRPIRLPASPLCGSCNTPIKNAN